MFRNVLVPATGLPGDAAVFATALALVRPFGGHLDMLHVRTDTTEVLLSMTAGGVGGGDAVQSVIDRIEAEAVAAEQAAQRAVEAFCAANGVALRDAPAADAGPSASWTVELGSAPRWMAEYGRFADAVVVGRGEPGQGGDDVLEAALMETGRPLLIAPRVAPATLARRVLIAWKDTAEAARAVSCALPLVARASQVVVATVAEADEEDDPGAVRLERVLRWHNPACRLRRLPADGRPAVDVLLAEAAAMEADLLVMGGYSHSRLREVVLGGATRRILADASLPVLMAH